MTTVTDRFSGSASDGASARYSGTPGSTTGARFSGSASEDKTDRFDGGFNLGTGGFFAASYFAARYFLAGHWLRGDGIVTSNVNSPTTARASGTAAGGLTDRY
jgi:hypothetical protein